jgi:hypothetical protein
LTAQDLVATGLTQVMGHHLSNSNNDIPSEALSSPAHAKYSALTGVHASMKPTKSNKRPPHVDRPDQHLVHAVRPRIASKVVARLAGDLS